MKQLIANTITTDFLTSKGGLDIGKNIETLLQGNPFELVQVSFNGVTNLSPSFVNGAFLYLIDNYGADYFRSRVKVVNATSEVASIIRDSVRIYLDRQNAFFDTLKVNKLYLASDGSKNGDEIISELRKISITNGFNNIASPENTGTPDYRKLLIENSDAIIGILTNNHYKEYLGKQIEIAVATNKPCILLIHTNLDLRLPTNSHHLVHCIYYNDLNYLDQLKKLNKIITDYKKDDPNIKVSHFNSNNSNSQTVAIGAIIAIALLAVLLYLALGISDKKNKDDFRGVI